MCSHIETACNTCLSYTGDWEWEEQGTEKERGKLSVSYSIVSVTASSIVWTILFDKKCINRKLRERNFDEKGLFNVVYLLFLDDLIKRFIRNEIILSEFEINHKHPQKIPYSLYGLCVRSRVGGVQTKITKTICS